MLTPKLERMPAGKEMASEASSLQEKISQGEEKASWSENEEETSLSSQSCLWVILWHLFALSLNNDQSCVKHNFKIESQRHILYV